MNTAINTNTLIKGRLKPLFVPLNALIQNNPKKVLVCCYEGRGVVCSVFYDTHLVDILTLGKMDLEAREKAILDLRRKHKIKSANVVNY